MVPLLRASLATVLSSAAVISTMPALAASGDAVDLSARLQLALNADDRVQALSALMAPDQVSTLIERFRRFSMRFPETRWAVRPGQALDDGRPTVQLAVSGTRQQDGLSYSFKANQRLAFSTEAGLITAQEVLSDQSVLTSSKKPLPISLLIPDTVLPAVVTTWMWWWINPWARPCWPEVSPR